MKPPANGYDGDDNREMPQDSGEGDSVQQIADELLVDALLAGRAQDTPLALSRRVDAVCRAFETPTHRIWRHWRAGLSTAAVAVLAVGLLLIFSSPQDVQADLSEILEVFDAGDKTYQIDISADAYQPLRRGRRGGRGRVGRGQPFRVPRPRPTPRYLDGALLYVRGNRYVLECRTPAGLTIVKGYDGQQSWLIGPAGQARQGGDVSQLQRDIPENIASLLFLDLRNMLGRVAQNYQVSEPTEWTLQDSQKHVLCYVAERTSRMARLPRRIELWVDAQTNQLDHIICTGVSLRGPSVRYTLRIDLVSTDPLPAEWFTQATHLVP